MILTSVKGLSRCMTRIILDNKIALLLSHYCTLKQSGSWQDTAAPQARKTHGSISFCHTKHLRFVCMLFLYFFCFLCSRSLNELRVLLLESHRHSRDMEKDLNREVHKAEWRVKEQKLQEDIKTLREKLLLLVRGKDFVMIK